MNIEVAIFNISTGFKIFISRWTLSYIDSQCDVLGMTRPARFQFSSLSFSEHLSCEMNFIFKLFSSWLTFKNWINTGWPLYLVHYNPGIFQEFSQSFQGDYRKKCQNYTLVLFWTNKRSKEFNILNQNVIILPEKFFFNVCL